MNTHNRVGGRASGVGLSSAPRCIGEAMRPGVVTIQREHPIDHAISLLRLRRTAYAVVLSGHVIEGVLAKRDLEALSWMARGSRQAAWMRELTVEDVMRTPPAMLPTSATLREAGKLLQEGTRDCVVVMCDGRPVGIITENELRLGDSPRVWKGAPTERGGPVGS